MSRKKNTAFTDKVMTDTKNEGKVYKSITTHHEGNKLGYKQPLSAHCWSWISNSSDES